MKILHFHADIEAVAACGIPGEGALHRTQHLAVGQGLTQEPHREGGSWRKMLRPGARGFWGGKTGLSSELPFTPARPSQNLCPNPPGSDSWWVTLSWSFHEGIQALKCLVCLLGWVFRPGYFPCLSYYRGNGLLVLSKPIFLLKLRFHGRFVNLQGWTGTKSKF